MILNTITTAVLQAVYSNLKADFNAAFSEAPVQYTEIASVVPSASSENVYGWVDDWPDMEEWIGKKTIKQLAENGYAIRNKAYEVTIAVKRHRLQDNQVGVYKIQAQGAGKSAKQLPDKEVFGLLNNAFDANCFDGKPFFATNHKVGKTTVSNKGTKALSIETLAKAQASFGAARIEMRKFKNDNGQPLNINPNILVVPPALGDIARALMTVDRLEDGKPNPYKGAAKVIEVARLTSDTAWFLLDTTQAIKPLIWQDRESAHLVSQTDLSADRVFMEGEFLFGAEARGNAGFSFWQLGYGSDGTVA